MAIVCYDRRALRALLSRYSRLKFAIQHVDFWRSCKTGRNDAKMTSYSAVLSKAGRGERDGCDVL